MKASHGALGLVLLALGGCSTTVADTEVARRVIGPGGGTITSVDSVLTIAILPDALEEQVEFFVEASDEPPPTLRQAYLVRPTPELAFGATITYRTPLDADASGLAVGAVDPVAFADGRGRWVPLPVLRVDVEQGLVTGLDDRISIFYALLDQADATTDLPGTDDGMETGGTDDTGPPPTTDGDGTSTGGTSGPGQASTSTGAESGGEPAVSFAAEIQPIITASCECHLEADPPVGLNMIDAYANLVDVASVEAAGLDRIEPGAPADSYLWHKVNGTHLSVGGTGNPMPAPRGGLDAATLATIEAWILDGAPP